MPLADAKWMACDRHWSWPDARDVAYALAAALSCIVVAVFVRETRDVGKLPVETLATKGWIAVVAVAMVTVVVVPIIEEYLFRGLLLDWLSRRVNPWLAIAITGGIFGLLHLHYSLHQRVPLFLLGWWAGYLYLRNRNLTVPVLAHCLYNSPVIIGLVYKARLVSGQ